MTKRTYSIDAPDQQRLKVARLKVEAVLREHDLAGVVVLHTPGMTEFFYDIRPTYSCAWIDESVPIVRVKSLGADYGNDLQAQQHDQAATANMMRSIADDLIGATAMFVECAAVVDRILLAKHLPGTSMADPAQAKPQ